MKKFLAITLTALLFACGCTVSLYAQKKTPETRSAKEYFTKGDNAIENGFYELAIEYYQKAIAIDPNYAAAYYKMGNAYGNLGNTRGIIKYFRKVAQGYIVARKIKEDDTSIIFLIIALVAALFAGGYYMISPDTQKKIPEILSAEAYLTKGNNTYEKGSYELALKYYEQAIAIDPDYAAAYYNKGVAYDDLKDYCEAIRCYEKALAIDPNYAYAYYNMGIAYGNLGDTQKQIKNYRKAAQLGDEDAQKWLQDNGYGW
jgi:superkiller protein 3